MTKILLLLWLLVFMFSAITYAGTEDKIIDHYKKAVGGDATKKITSKVISGTVKQGNKTGKFLYQATSPDHIRTDVEFDKDKISECYNGNSAWRQDQNLHTIIGAEAKTLRLKALLINTYLRDLSHYRITIQSLGKVQVENFQVDVLEFKLNDAYIKLMFDTKTGLLVKQERQLNDGVEETIYKDYRLVNKVMEPFLVKVKNPTSEVEIIVDKIDYNTKISETAFRYPSADGSVPIPDVEALIKQLETNQEKIKELRELYTFRSTQIESELEGNGQVKKTTTKVYENTPIAGTFVERLVSIDGRQLSPDEQEKEDKRVKKQIEEAKKEQKKREQKKKDKDDDGDISILTFLKILSIKDAHRDKFRDQDVLIFDFEPRKDYKPKNFAENVVSKLVGTMFVDESAKQIVRLEARLSDSVKFGGGLVASLSPSSAFVFEQEKIRGEIWLPSYSEINFGGRVLLFVKVNQNEITRYSDYKKYQTDVEIKSDTEATSETK